MTDNSSYECGFCHYPVQQQDLLLEKITSCPYCQAGLLLTEKTSLPIIRSFIQKQGPYSWSSVSRGGASKKAPEYSIVIQASSRRKAPFLVTAWDDNEELNTSLAARVLRVRALQVQQRRDRGELQEARLYEGKYWRITRRDLLDSLYKLNRRKRPRSN